MPKYKDCFVKISDNSFVDNKIIIRDKALQTINLKRKVFYKCDICKEEFVTGNSIRANCRKLCGKHHFYYICDYCNKEFEITRLSDFIGSSSNLRFCSYNCALQHRNRSEEMKKVVTSMNISRVSKNLNKTQKCSKCGKQFHSIFPMNICNGCITSETNKQNYKKDQICKKCGKTFHSSFIMDLGPCCNPNIKGTPNFITKNNVKYYKGMEVKDFVSKILNDELDINQYPEINIRYGKVCYGTEDILTSNKIYQNSNFIEINNVRYYKGIEVETFNEFVKKVLSGELDINNDPSINIRYGRVCYGTEDILTSEKLIKNNSNFEEKDDILYFYDRSVCDYVPWNDYKKKFINISNNMELNNNFNDLLQGFKFYSTFRSQNSSNWENGSKSAFEQSLVDTNIHWFVYIKFYIDYRTKNIKPLVVGKSGSLLVNSSGSDLSFSTDINDGPARRFLAETNN